MFVKLSPSLDKVLSFDDVTAYVFKRDMQLAIREWLKELHRLLEEITLFTKRATTETDIDYLLYQMKFYVLDRERTITFFIC